MQPLLLTLCICAIILSATWAVQFQPDHYRAEPPVKTQATSQSTVIYPAIPPTGVSQPYQHPHPKAKPIP